VKEIPVDEAMLKPYPDKVILVTCAGADGKVNIIPLGWSMQTSFRPRLVAISVGKTRHSHKLISESREFVLAVPGEDLAQAVRECGSCSGRSVDKFRKTGLRAVPAKKVNAPLIGECISNNECKVIATLDTGDHTIFVGEVVAAHLSDEDKKPLYHFGGHELRGL
jgi:flavin reductase (DIM6/NTAB) family NADH-FMN oxidoreductase RutF